MEKQLRSATEMVKMFEEDNSLLTRLKEDPNPLSVIKETADKAEVKTEPIYLSDKVLYRIAVTILGSLALIAAIGSVILVIIDKTTPEVLVALGSAAVGALVGLFAPSPTSKQ